MIITKDFIVLNLPKTGSTFVRKVLIKIYENRMNQYLIMRKLYKWGIYKPPYSELLLPNIRLKDDVKKNLGQHGTFKFLSAYEFGWYKEHPALTSDLLNKHFPNFPNLSMDDYVDYSKLVVNHALLKRPSDVKIGTQSIQFIQFFSKNPDLIIENLESNVLVSGEVNNLDLADITFLQQENLNEELGGFLQKHKFKSSEVELALNFKKMNVTRTTRDRNYC